MYNQQQNRQQGGYGQQQQQRGRQNGPPPQQQQQRQQVPPPSRTDPNDFLMGGSVPSATFKQYGDTVEGVICEQPTVQQQRDILTGDPKFWPDGNPMEQLVVTLQTDERDPQIEEDDGRRRIFVKFNMKTAIQAAVKAAGAKGINVGGSLRVTFTHEGQAERPGMNPPKFYEAEYTLPASNFLGQPDRGGHDSFVQSPGPRPPQQQQSHGLYDQQQQASQQHVINSTFADVQAAYAKRIADYKAEAQNDPFYNEPANVTNTFGKLMSELFPGRRPSQITAAEWGTAFTAVNEDFSPATRGFIGFQ